MLSNGSSSTYVQDGDNLVHVTVRYLPLEGTNMTYPDEQASFAGPCFMPHRKSWSQYYRVERSKILNSSNLLLADFTDHPESAVMEDIRQDVLTMAAAAVRVFIITHDIVPSDDQPAKDLSLSNGRPATQSIICLTGFWVGDYVMTCNHGLPTAENFRSALSNPKSLEASCFACDFTNASPDPTDNIKLQLVDNLDDDNMALFRRCEDIFQADPSLKPQHVLDVKKDLEALPTGATANGLACFTVAYCGHDMPLDRQFEIYRSRKDPIVYNRIIKDHNPQTKYHYMWWNFFESLKNSKEGNSFRATMGYRVNEAYRPFESIFWPDTRALAVGRIISRDPSNTLHVSPSAQDYPRDKYAREEPLCISAYHGCSGAMVVVFLVDKESHKQKPKVIGLLAAGDFARPFNKLKAFTGDGVKWIKGHVEGTSHPRYVQPSTSQTSPVLDQSIIGSEPYSHGFFPESELYSHADNFTA